MCIENSNSAIHVLVLARPADSVCALLTAAMGQWRYEFSVYSTVYEVLSTVKVSPVDVPLILVVRPIMLGIPAALFMYRHFPNVRMIGWMDPDENVSDYMITQMTINGMVLASRIEQLQQIIDAYNTIALIRPVPDTEEMTYPEQSDRVEYELSDDEINALLGVE